MAIATAPTPILEPIIEETRIEPEVLKESRTAVECRAHRGALLLDERNPGWADRINLRRLRIKDPDDCVLGQLYGAFSVGLCDVFLMYSSWDVYGHGFSVNPSDGPGLDAAWVREIRQRRHRD